MVVKVAGDLTIAPNIIELHGRLLAARGEILRSSPDECTVDFREVSEFGVNAMEMVSCFMRWFRDHYPCGRVELLL
jgi:hypothetical protein